MTPLAAIVIGALTSLICFTAVNFKAKIQFDDSLDTFPIQGVGGTTGAILTGLFVRPSRLMGRGLMVCSMAIPVSY